MASAANAGQSEMGGSGGGRGMEVSSILTIQWLENHASRCSALVGPFTPSGTTLEEVTGLCMTIAAC